MLSDYLFTGVVAGAAMLAVGLLAHALPSHADGIEDERRSLMVLLAAFVEGLGILAVVYGLAALFVDVFGGGGVQAAVLVLLPATALGIPAALLARPGHREGVRAGMTLMLAFIGGLAATTATVVLMALFASEVEAAGFDGITIVAMLVIAVSAIGIGMVGARALGQMAGDEDGQTEVDWSRLRSRTVLAASILEGVAVIAYVVVLMMMFSRE